VVVILVAAPDDYGQALRLPSGRLAGAEIAFLIALSAFIALLCRRAPLALDPLADLGRLLAGIWRLPAVILQLTGVLNTSAPTW
jgi:hypothetical protein